MIIVLGALLALFVGIGAILIYRRIRFGSVYKYKPDEESTKIKSDKENSDKS